MKTSNLPRQENQVSIGKYIVHFHRVSQVAAARGQQIPLCIAGGFVRQPSRCCRLDLCSALSDRASVERQSDCAVESWNHTKNIPSHCTNLSLKIFFNWRWLKIDGFGLVRSSRENVVWRSKIFSGACRQITQFRCSNDVARSLRDTTHCLVNAWELCFARLHFQTFVGWFVENVEIVSLWWWWWCLRIGFRKFSFANWISSSHAKRSSERVIVYLPMRYLDNEKPD